MKETDYILYDLNKSLAAIDAINENVLKTRLFTETRLCSTGTIVKNPSDYSSDKLFTKELSYGLIRLPYKPQYTQYTDNTISSALSCMHDIDKNIKTFEILDRINTYLRVVTYNLSTINEMFGYLCSHIEYQKAGNIVLSSSIEDFKQNAGFLALTEHNVYAQNTFNTLSNFFHDTCLGGKAVFYDVELSENRAYILNLLSAEMFTQKYYAPLFFDQNIKTKLNSSSLQTNLDLEYECVADKDQYTSIINTGDILFILDSFIQKLKNIKKTQFTFNHKQSQFKNYIEANGRLAVQIESSKTNNEGQRVSIAISPYMQQTMVQSDVKPITFGSFNTLLKNSIFSTNNDNENIINLFGILYDISAEVSTPAIIPLDPNKSNGIFAHELLTTKHDNFNLTINDIKKLFSITKGHVINRKTILHAIDYIFNYWLNNISTIDYTITTCHSNCHINEDNVHENYTGEIIKSNKFPIEGTVYLHYTGGCGCSIIEEAVIDFNKIKGAIGTFKEEPLYATLEIGGYASNTNSPKYCKIETMLGIEIKNIGNSDGGVSPFSNRLITETKVDADEAKGHTAFKIEAKRAENKKNCQNYFCIAVTLRTRYRIENIEIV